ncbi:MAG TPA: hypothetical protein VGK32_03560 [Vicinamibacterales bacterium]|jgi:hypothetical protein
MVYCYRPEVLTALLRHGLRPLASTSPERLRSILHDWYRFELQRLRAALLRGEFQKSTYAARVAEIRTRYALLSLPSHFWLR